MFTKEGGAVHGDQGAFLPRTLSQWSDPAAQDISAEEDKTGDRIEELPVCPSLLSHAGRPESILLVRSLSKWLLDFIYFKDDVCIKWGFCNQVLKACHLNNKHSPPPHCLVFGYWSWGHEQVPSF